MTLRDAQQIAHGLIQGYVGPDHRVIDMPSFYNALVQRFGLPIRKAGIIEKRKTNLGPSPSERPTHLSRADPKLNSD